MADNRAEIERMITNIRRFAEDGCREVVRKIATASNASPSASAPVGTFGKTSDHPGELRGSLRVTLNGFSQEESPSQPFYPLFGEAEVDAALVDFQLGDLIGMAWIARHANIIQGGRRPDRHGRMIGSEQRPDGWVHLARDEALSQMDRWRPSA